jgi:hypothetical protein
MIEWQMYKKGLELRYRDIIEALSQCLPEGTEENHLNFKRSGVPTLIQTNYLPSTSLNEAVLWNDVFGKAA